MPFTKETAAAAGRKSNRGGVRNKSTQTTISLVKYLIDGGLQKFENELNKLEGEEYVKYFTVLIKYISNNRHHASNDLELIKLINSKIKSF